MLVRNKEVNDVDDYKKIEHKLTSFEKNNLLQMAWNVVKFNMIKYIYMHLDEYYIIRRSVKCKNKKIAKWLFNVGGTHMKNLLIFRTAKQIELLERSMNIYYYMNNIPSSIRIMKFYRNNKSEFLRFCMDNKSEFFNNIELKDKKKLFNFKVFRNGLVECEKTMKFCCKIYLHVNGTNIKNGMYGLLFKNFDRKEPIDRRKYDRNKYGVRYRYNYTNLLRRNIKVNITFSICEQTFYTVRKNCFLFGFLDNISTHIYKSHDKIVNKDFINFIKNKYFSNICFLKEKLGKLMILRKNICCIEMVKKLENIIL
jgi:hypothetical protein